MIMLNSPLSCVRRTGVTREASIIDVGGGASTLVDEGYTSVAVLDLSEAALAVSQSRLGQRAAAVSWLVGDITRVELPRHAYDVWHDRAVFHFLTSQREREAYLQAVLRAVKPWWACHRRDVCRGRPRKMQWLACDAL